MERVALITGASSGIGEGLSRALARRGWAVGLLARRGKELVRIAEEIRGAGGRAHPLPCDVTDRAGVARAREELEERLGPVDLLVANAGIGGNTSARDFDADAMEKIFRVNVLGMIYAMEAALPGMLERGRGQVVGVSSLAGFRGLPVRPAYSASKAAMTTFLEGLRIELRGSGVGVTIVSPGWVRTPMTEGNRHPMPFLMDVGEAVEEIVGAIEKGRRHLAFPRLLATLVRLLRILPAPLYDRLGGLAVRRHRRD